MTRKHQCAVRMLTVLVSSLGALLALPRTNASRGADIFAYVVEQNGNFDQLDITTGAVSIIRNNDSPYGGLAFGPQNAVLYGISARTNLVTINPSTGVITLVGSTGVNFSTLTSLANGHLYGVDLNDNLYSIAPTGVSTLIGPTGLPPLTVFHNSLASNGTALYYTLDTNGGNSSLYTLNLATGAATIVGPTGVTGIVGSAFAGPTFASGQLYAFLNNGDTDVINTATGAATRLNANGLTDIFGGVGIFAVASVPEPSGFVMALISGAMGLLGYVGHRLRRPKIA